jgi:hypothetical protein
MEIDLAYGSYGLPEDVERQLQEMNEKHMQEHPVCEICRSRPSVRITPIGTLRAACLECIADMRRQVAEEIEFDWS